MTICVPNSPRLLHACYVLEPPPPNSLSGVQASFLLPIYSQKAQLKALKSSEFRDFQQPKFDQNLGKIPRFVCMVPLVGSRKYRRDVLKL